MAQQKINGQYLYNRSHLIGYQLSGENANWKNLITGTRQLNSPEMLRFEMDIKYYLEKSTKNYVRYSVVPVFRGDELLARGVHMMAQSVGSDAIHFNVYIFNVQEGVTLNYADGTSTLAKTVSTHTSSSAPSSRKEYVDSNGKGLIKGSKAESIICQVVNITTIPQIPRHGSKPLRRQKRRGIGHQNNF